MPQKFWRAHVLPAISPEHWMGAKNSEFVLKFREMEAIALVSRDLGRARHPKDLTSTRIRVMSF